MIRKAELGQAGASLWSSLRPSQHKCFQWRRFFAHTKISRQNPALSPLVPTPQQANFGVEGDKRFLAAVVISVLSVHLAAVKVSGAMLQIKKNDMATFLSEPCSGRILALGGKLRRVQISLSAQDRGLISINPTRHKMCSHRTIIVGCR